MIVIRPTSLSVSDPALPYFTYSYRLSYTPEVEAFRESCKKTTIRQYSCANMCLTIFPDGARKAWSFSRRDIEHKYGPSYRVYCEDIVAIESDEFPLTTDALASTFDIYDDDEWHYDFYADFYTVSWRGKKLPRECPF